jgi:hypothetical protein
MDLVTIFIGLMLVVCGAVFFGFPIGSILGKREALKLNSQPPIFIEQQPEKLSVSDDVLEAEFLETPTKEKIVVGFDGLLSKEDFFKLLQAIKRDGNINETEAEKLTKWATEALTQAGLVTLVMNGFLKVQGWDENGFPLLVPTDEEYEKKTNEA